MNILNGNDHQRGWTDGRNDALASRDKDYRRMGSSIKFALHGNITLETYIQGYDEGYSVGLREKNTVFKTELLLENDKNMATSRQTAQDFERELRAIEQLNNLLVNQVCDRLIMVNARMQGFIHRMVDTGIAFQACENYKNQYYQVDAMLFQNLYNHIVQADLPQIQRYYEMIASEFEQATGSRVSLSLRRPSSNVSPSAPRDAVTRSGGISDLEIQAEATCSFMNYLVDERDEMIQTLKDYQDRLNDMIAEGVPQQIVNHYVANYVPENVNNIKQSVAHLKSEDYPYLERILRQTVSDIKALGGNFNAALKSM